MKKLYRFLAGIVLSVWVIGQGAAAQQITVFAAASLTNALDDYIAAYQQTHPSVRVVASYASSSTLARQIVEGAPADIFISADQKWMDFIAVRGQIIPQTRRTLLGNTLVLIAPVDSALDTITLSADTPWRTLLKAGRLATGDPDHVPAGIYARQALQSLGTWRTLEPKLARANNVRAALMLVARKEAPLGIVYGSDVLASADVKVVGTFPESSHPPIEYPLAVIAKHDNPVVRAFWSDLQGAEAAKIFTKYGFTPRQ